MVIWKAFQVIRRTSVFYATIHPASQGMHGQFPGVPRAPQPVGVSLCPPQSSEGVLSLVGRGTAAGQRTRGGTRPGGACRWTERYRRGTCQHAQLVTRENINSPGQPG